MYDSDESKAFFKKNKGSLIRFLLQKIYSLALQIAWWLTSALYSLSRGSGRCCLLDLIASAIQVAPVFNQLHMILGLVSPRADIPQVQLEHLLQIQIQNLSSEPGPWQAGNSGATFQCVSLCESWSKPYGNTDSSLGTTICSVTIQIHNDTKWYLSQVLIIPVIASSL